MVLGEDHKIVLVSVAEGEDKPLKYPLIFRNASLAVINKMDAADALDADIDLLKTLANRTNGKQFSGSVEDIEAVYFLISSEF